MRIISQNKCISIPAERFVVSVLKYEDSAEVIAYDSSKSDEYITLGRYEKAEQAEYEFSRINECIRTDKREYTLSKDLEDKENVDE